MTHTSSECTTYFNFPHHKPGKILRRILIVKILGGPIWEGRLVKFVGVFAKRREDFIFAMAAHTTIGVDSANLKMDNLSQKYAVSPCILEVKVLTTCLRMDVMLQLFKEFATPQQKELAAMVENMGGDAVLNDKQAMEELVRVEPKLTVRPGRKDGGGRFNFVELQKEIKESPDKAIERNAEFFSGKFEIQKREIEEIVTRESDRVISAVIAGPHDRIIDPVSLRLLLFYDPLLTFPIRISTTYGRTWWVTVATAS